MTQGRVLAIHLEGYDEAVGRRLMSEGELPALARLRADSARVLLRHGEQAVRTGLAGEHFATGLRPESTGHWSDVYFDRTNYRAWQITEELPSFVSVTGIATVVFDSSHFCLDLTPEARGVVNWGTHGPAVPMTAAPEELRDELLRRFGPYPAGDWLYGFAWPSAERCRRMAASLRDGVRARTAVATWLLGERLPEWRLGVMTSSELHAASEAFWYGIDPTHPLHRAARTTEVAAEALESVYCAIDNMIGELVAAFPDATLVVFAMGGIGQNRSDLPSMALLPELLFRRSFARPLLQPRTDWLDPQSPTLGENENWVLAVREAMREALDADKARDAVRFKTRKHRSGSEQLSLRWMPASRYEPYWRDMDAFALPSFTDGRIRINLKGREAHGCVAPGDYEAKQREIEDFVRACIDPRTGESVVDYVERLSLEEALEANPTACDVMLGWRGTAQAFEHPVVGTVGPIPYNRSGGHTGPYGFAYLKAPDMTPRDLGEASSFDVVPTLFQLLGEPVPARLAGRGMLAAVH